MTKPLLIITLSFCLAACWNGENVHVSMGDVSFGQQLIDLKAALDEEAITPKEYQRTKQRLLELTSLCENIDEEGRRRDRDHEVEEQQEDDDDDDGFSWF